MKGSKNGNGQDQQNDQVLTNAHDQKESQQSEHSHNGSDSSKTENASKGLRKASRLSNSRAFQHNPHNVNKYFEAENKISLKFDEAKNVTKQGLKNIITGDLGELATEQSIYALRGNERVKIYETKVGGKSNNGYDHVARKGKPIFKIETKATTNSNTTVGLKTSRATKIQQMDSRWEKITHERMKASPSTAKTVTLLETPHNYSSKHISGVQVDYQSRKTTLFTEPNRYKELPADVTIWDSAKRASKNEMRAMKTLNSAGKALSLASYVFDVAQIVGQLHHDHEKGSYGATVRLILEKGIGYAMAGGATAGVEAITGGAGFSVAFVVGGEGYKLGESVGTGISNLAELPTISPDERDASMRDGMDMIAGPAGLAVLEGIDKVSQKISEGVSKGCEFLNDKLPFNVCTPEATKPSPVPQEPQPEEKKPEVQPANPPASEQADTEHLISRSETTKENSSGKSLGFHARRMEIMQSRLENNSDEKSLGFYARRDEIILSRDVNSNSASTTQEASLKSEEKLNSTAVNKETNKNSREELSDDTPRRSFS